MPSSHPSMSPPPAAPSRLKKLENGAVCVSVATLLAGASLSLGDIGKTEKTAVSVLGAAFLVSLGIGDGARRFNESQENKKKAV